MSHDVSPARQQAIDLVSGYYDAFNRGDWAGMLERLDGGALGQTRPLVETSSVPMARRLVARSAALGFMVPDNVAEDVAAGSLVWRALHD